MRNIYADGQYLAQNPTWHAEDSPWKASQVQKLIGEHHLELRTVAEVGCGVGEVLAELRRILPGEIDFHGFDIAEAAISIARKREYDRLTFHCEDLLHQAARFDLLLALDVMEHVPDYLGFLEGCRSRATHKIYHIPLDIHASSVIRGSLLQSRYAIGHLHYFTAESALASLADTGHEIISSCYTDGGLALADLHPSTRRRLANIPRRLVSTLSTRLSARLLGGYSLLVLAR